MQSFRLETKDLTAPEKVELLYRLPWHLRMLTITSHGAQWNVELIGNIIGFDVFEEMDYSTSYFEIGEQDQDAVDVIADDLKEGHETVLKDSLTKELPVIFQFASILSLQIEDGQLDRSALEQLVGEDKEKNHAAAIVTYMFNKLVREKRLADFDEYVLMQMFF